MGRGQCADSRIMPLWQGGRALTKRLGSEQSEHGHIAREIINVETEAVQAPVLQPVSVTRLTRHNAFTPRPHIPDRALFLFNFGKKFSLFSRMGSSSKKSGKLRKIKP